MGQDHQHRVPPLPRQATCHTHANAETKRHKRRSGLSNWSHLRWLMGAHCLDGVTKSSLAGVGVVYHKNYWIGILALRWRALPSLELELNLYTLRPVNSASRTTNKTSRLADPCQTKNSAVLAEHGASVYKYVHVSFPLISIRFQDVLLHNFSEPNNTYPQ
jgi:hypothetical protein